MANSPTAEQQEQIQRALAPSKDEYVRRNRQIFMNELRRQAHRQCTGALFRNGKVCALGLLLETFSRVTGRDYTFDTSHAVDLALAWIGFSQEHGSRIIRMNDSGISFPEIASYVAGDTLMRVPEHMREPSKIEHDHPF